MTDDRKQTLRFEMWMLARSVMVDTANDRSKMPIITDEEYEYARAFLLRIAGNTKPGNYREPDDREEHWCEICEEEITESHYHCAKCNQVCSMAGHRSCEAPSG